MLRRFVRGVVALMVGGGVLVAASLSSAPVVVAATGSTYGVFSALTGQSTDYRGTMTLARLFPEATVTTDSRSGQVGPQSGASIWLPAWTPVGQRYGSSQRFGYLTLRPKADGPTTPSTTTYSFATGTPQGWAFVLGDIDADAVTVTALREDGTVASAADLGFRGAFNFCSRTPRPSGCPGEQTDVPTWDPAHGTLTGHTEATDTVGATGWFEPTVSLSTLTLVFVRRTGFPVYQTWFALRTQDLTGTVTVASGSCELAGVSVDLVDRLDEVVSSTMADASGRFAFPGLPATDGYRVVIGNLPTDCLVVGPSEQTVDLTDGDGSATFSLRQTTRASVEGVVTDDVHGTPVGDVTVVLTPAGGGPAVTTTTDADGRYLIDGLVPGSYVVSIVQPDGYLRVSGDRTVVIPSAGGAITAQDFSVAENPTVGGRVTDGADPVAGVVVELHRLDGSLVERAVTDGAGDYTFPQTSRGDYVVSVPNPPDGYDVPPRQAADVTHGDSLDNDFVLSRPGSLGGTVSDPAGARGGVTVTVTGPAGYSRTLTTDGFGRYDVTGLPPGGYTITLTPPAGTSAAVVVRSVTITSAGESFGAEDFALRIPSSPTTSPTSPTATPTASASPPVSPTTGAPSPASTPPAASSGQPLAATGTEVLPLLAGGLALVVLGVVATMVGRRPRSPRDDL